MISFTLILFSLSALLQLVLGMRLPFSHSSINSRDLDSIHSPHSSPIWTLGGLFARDNNDQAGDDSDLDGIEDAWNTTTVPFYTYKLDFKTFDDLSNFHNGVGTAHRIIPADGAMDRASQAYFTLKILINMLDQATTDYADANDGYDDYFKIYKDYIRDQVPEILLHKLMYTMIKTDVGERHDDGPAMKFFDCTIKGRTTACPDRSKEMSNSIETQFKLRDADGWNKAIAEQGLSPDFVAFGDSSIRTTSGDNHEKTNVDQPLKNFPIRNDSMIVTNPKDIVLAALKNVTQLRQDMLSTSIEIAIGQWHLGHLNDPTLVYSLPVFTIMQGVDNMKQAKEAAKEIKAAEDKEAEEKKKNLILLIVTMVLAFVPVVGQELAAAAGLATLARTIMILGELANGAMTLYDTVENPQNAAINVIGMLVGLGGLAKTPRTTKGLSDLTVIRNGIKAESINAFGKVFSSNEAKMQGIIKLCRKA